MKKALHLLLLLTLLLSLTDCALLPSSPSSFPQASSSAPVVSPVSSVKVPPTPSPTAEPAEFSTLYQYHSADQLWTVWNGETVYYIGQDGLYVMNDDGTSDRLIYQTNSSRDIYQIFPLVNGKVMLFLNQWMEEWANSLPDWVEDWAYGATPYSIVLVDPVSKQSACLAEMVQKPVFLSPSKLFTVTLTPDHRAQILNFEKETIEAVSSVTFSEEEWPIDIRFCTDGNIQIDAVYPVASPQDALWQTSERHCYSLNPNTMEFFPDEENFACSVILPYLLEPAGQDDCSSDSNTEGSFVLDLQYNSDWTHCTADVYQNEIGSGPSLMHIELSADLDWEENPTPTAQPADGIYHVYELERTSPELCGNWLFLYSSYYTDGITGGPDFYWGKLRIRTE